MSIADVPDHPLRPAAEADLALLMPHVERLTGQRSRWAGIVWVRDLSFGFSGQKHGWCGISLREDVLRDEPFRWRTMIHEALHSVSGSFAAGRLDPTSGRWEEAIVEQTQRLLRQSLLRAIRVSISEDAFRPRDVAHRYNAHIRAMEIHRATVRVAPEPFYLGLLRANAPGRAAAVLAVTRALRDVQSEEAL